MPTRGENASPTPMDVPPKPLASPYVRTALMNETPTSGPVRISMIHQDLDDMSSRHSFARSHSHGGLREGKKHLFEIRRIDDSASGSEFCQLRARSFGADTPPAQQDEAIANFRGLGDLVDREKKCPASGDAPSERLRNLAALAQIEAI